MASKSNVQKNKEFSEFAGKDSRELLYDLQETRKKLFDARLQMSNEASKSSDIRHLRRTVARILTVLNRRKGQEQVSTES